MILKGPKICTIIQNCVRLKGVVFMYIKGHIFYQCLHTISSLDISCLYKCNRHVFLILHEGMYCDVTTHEGTVMLPLMRVLSCYLQWGYCHVTSHECTVKLPPMRPLSFYHSWGTVMLPLKPASHVNVLIILSYQSDMSDWYLYELTTQNILLGHICIYKIKYNIWEIMFRKCIFVSHEDKMKLRSWKSNLVCSLW